MTKLGPQYQAWRVAKASKYAESEYSNLEEEGGNARSVAYLGHLAGAEAEHEAAKLVGAIEAYEDAGVGHPHIFRARNAAQARLDALLRGGG